jgi:hypothetical protein
MNPQFKQMWHIYICLLIVNFLFFISCTKFYKHRTVIEPTNITIIDESRVDNMKVRHIFKEFLVKGIIDNSKKWLTVFELSSINSEDIQAKYIDYIISFDIMDYGTFDIEKGTDKILASVKILKGQNNVVLGSFIEGIRGKDIEKSCAHLED